MQAADRLKASLWWKWLYSGFDKISVVIMPSTPNLDSILAGPSILQVFRGEGKTAKMGMWLLILPKNIIDTVGIRATIYIHNNSLICRVFPICVSFLGLNDLVQRLHLFWSQVNARGVCMKEAVRPLNHIQSQKLGVRINTKCARDESSGTYNHFHFLRQQYTP